MILSKFMAVNERKRILRRMTKKKSCTLLTAYEKNTKGCFRNFHNWNIHFLFLFFNTEKLILDQNHTINLLIFKIQVASNTHMEISTTAVNLNIQNSVVTRLLYTEFQRMLHYLSVHITSKKETSLSSWVVNRTGFLDRLLWC